MYKGKDFGKKLCKASGHCTDKASASKKKEKKEDKKPKADKKPDQKTDKKVEKKEQKAPKADPKKDPITFDEYVKKLSSRGLAGSDVFTNKRTQKASPRRFFCLRHVFGPNLELCAQTAEM